MSTEQINYIESGLSGEVQAHIRDLECFPYYAKNNGGMNTIA